MRVRSTSLSIFERSVHRFFVRSKTRDFGKSFRNIAHAHKNRCSATMERSTCDDAFARKNARQPIEKQSKNRPCDARKTIRTTIAKSPKNHRKNGPNSMPKRFRERVAPQSDPKASRTHPRNVPEGPKSVPEASQAFLGASQERPGACRGDQNRR